MKARTRIYIVVTIILMAMLIWTASVTTHAKTKYCAKSNCYRTCASGSSYCYSHKSNSYSSGKTYSSSKKTYSSSKKKSYYDSYDDGYNAVYDDDDYDWDRYRKEWNYASGVDDALDDWDEYGEDW